MEICFLLSILSFYLSSNFSKQVSYYNRACSKISFMESRTNFYWNILWPSCCLQGSFPAAQQTAVLLGRQTFTMMPSQKGRESWLSDSVLPLHPSHPTLRHFQSFFSVTGQDDPIGNLFCWLSPVVTFCVLGKNGRHRSWNRWALPGMCRQESFFQLK